MRAVKMGGEAAEEEGFPSTPGKVKMERGGPGQYNRQLQRCFASTSSLFLWALFLVALTASYLSFQSFVDTSSRYLSASWGGLHWERRLRASARPRRPDGLCVLVTGAAGFVGSHASLALRRRGDGVLGLDNFNPYYDPSLKRARQSLLASHGVFVVEGDLNDAPLLARLFAAAPFTHVLHLAAQAGVRYALENPASYVRSNVAGLVALLEACRAADPQPAVVWASSSSVYGLNDKVPFSESDPTDRPASLYAATKKAGEEITHAYNHIYGLSVTGLRFFTVYGPWGRPDMAYFAFARAILQGKPITVYRGRDGVDLARDFTYIDDVVRGCVASLDTARPSTGGRAGRKRGEAQYRIYNLGNTSPVTVPALVGILERHLKAKARRNVVEMPGNGDVPFTHANISLARAELGYKPTTNLDAGLKKFVKWYLSYYGYTSRAGSGPNDKPNAAAAAAAAV
ncbi:UDP-glucuronate 4-epimerase 1 [Ananas comosus]|uniref:UDP-glucuronate 4-epimerase n=1 Tax=Ananas comosus TaxID=4615 RepID=A0A199ULT2_ANACO|nr:UDP-glucuronate 4-epimerase 1 [Ananas comosus]